MMKKAGFMVLLMVLLGLLPMEAQIRGNNINVMVVPDHQDWNYEVGQTAQFKVSVIKSSTLVDNVTVDYEAGPEMYPDVKKQGVALKDGTMTWKVPAGEHRLAYAPEAFVQRRNILSARIMTEEELLLSRDVARNPLDLRGDVNFFPHCTANVETRGESVFAARNVIDGLRFNTYHGEWPFESWGIGAREDAWCRIDFGREITAERMALTLRADFPHDAYWTAGHVVDSNGEDTAFSLRKTGE